MSYCRTETLTAIDAWWRASNYLSVGQIYLKDNALLSRPLSTSDIKPRLLGHWGTSPGLSFIYAHMNRIINERELDMIYITGPGHGGPAIVGSTWLEGSYSEHYPDVSRDASGMEKLFKQFSFPGGIPSHCAPEIPGSIHEGGELGYALAHAVGAAFDNKDLVVTCVIGDGEAETGPLAASWHSNKYLNPKQDGVVLPILHLNGWKIANPTIFARMSHQELLDFFHGHGYEPHFVEGDDPFSMHKIMSETLDTIFDDIASIKSEAENGQTYVARWPMIVLRTPKGWTGPKVVDEKPVEGTWRAHQVPLANVKNNAEHLAQLEVWLKSYRPEELFDEQGRPVKLITDISPKGDRRMGSSPYANGGKLLKDLKMPNFKDYKVDVQHPGGESRESTKVLGSFLAGVMEQNLESKNFCVVGPDETASNRLQDIYDITGKRHLGKLLKVDENLSNDGRVMEVLSEHLCQGWLEGYLLTGRHGIFSSYEAFIHIVISMFNQHAKWLKVCNEISWRQPIASLNYLLTSHVWRQDHNGFSHQDPGFIDHVLNKKPEVVQVYLPPDANTLLCVADKCLRSRNKVNVIVAGKQEQLQFLDMESAVKHCDTGIGIWRWASNDMDCEPDVVIASAGDVPTLEALAAVSILREKFQDLKIRFINVVDLMTLRPETEHDNGLSNAEFESLFTKDKPIIFAYHGYPWLIHRLTCQRSNHKNLHVRGYKEEGTTTTPFDMAVLNELDRFHLVIDVLNNVPKLASRAAHAKQEMRERLIEHKEYIYEHGEDIPDIREWVWRSQIDIAAE